MPTKKVSEKEGYVSVTSTVVGVNKQRVKKLKIRPFVTDTAHVSVKYGVTIPTQEYGSARVDVMMSAPCYVEEMVDTYKQIRELVDKLISAEVDRIEGGGDE